MVLGTLWPSKHKLFHLTDKCQNGYWVSLLQQKQESRSTLKASSIHFHGLEPTLVDACEHEAKSRLVFKVQ